MGKNGETRGTGMHVNNAYYDNVDNRPPLDGDLDGREDKSVINMGIQDILPRDRVRYRELGYGTVMDVWEDNGKTKFSVIFDVSRNKCEFTHPDVFIDGLMVMSDE